MEKLSKPPLVAAALRVTFPHNLKVSELRSAYYEDVKELFPNIQFPELKQMAYDFSDCHFQNLEEKAQIRLATNSFSMETLQYKNVDEFWRTFHGVFGKFANRMGVSEVAGLTTEFLNKIAIDANGIGANFSDYFTLGLTSKGQLQREFLTLDGAILFRSGQDLLQVDIRPVQNAETHLYDTFQFKLTFLSYKKCVVQGELKEIRAIFSEAHRHIEDIFRGSLTEKYWATIQ